MPDEERPDDQPAAESRGQAPGDEAPIDQVPADPAPDGPAAAPAPGLSPRRAPLRGSGSGFGMAGEGGGAARLLRRVQEAAEVARRAAEQHRPAAERAVREAAERARDAVEAAKPEAERLARQARAAAEAARPHVERAAGEAVQFARDHEDEVRAAAVRAACNAAPPSLRPAVDAMQAELQKRPAEPEQSDSAADEGPPPAGGPSPV